MTAQTQITATMPDVFYIVATDYRSDLAIGGWGSSDMTDRETARDEVASSELPCRVMELQCVDGFPKSVADVTEEIMAEIGVEDDADDDWSAHIAAERDQLRIGAFS